jgi:single-stranded DNA-binding protein
MNSNKFELIGKVNYVDVKASEKSGNVVTKVLLGIYLGKDKDGNAQYDSLEITMFGDVAEKFGDDVQKGDSVYVEGRISINKYTNKEGKEVKSCQFIANSYKKVSYDKDKKEFVVSGDSLPWDEK